MNGSLEAWIDLLMLTARIAIGAVALAAVPALVIGYLLARREFVGKSLVEGFVALPLVLPPTAVGYLLLELFSRRGPLGSESLGFDLGVLLTARGAMIATSVVCLPLISRTARAAFEAVDPRLESMGRSLGLSRSATFLRITLPLARRGLLAAMALGFGRAIGEFGATVIIAGNIPGRTQTLSLAIFAEIQAGDDGLAFQLVLAASAIAFAVTYWIERLSRPAARRATEAGA